MTEWPTEPLRDLGVWSGGGTPSKSRSDFWEDGDVPWLSPKDMGPESLVDTRDHITKSAVAGSAVRLLGPNAVAVVVRSGILERTIPVALVPFATTLNQDMKALECRPGIDPRWVAWGLRASERELLRTARKAGTTVASIEWSRFLNWRLPIPEHAEQRRILDILEDHLSRLDAANDYIDAASRRAQVLRASLLSRLAPPDAPVLTLGELATSSGYGTSAKCEIGARGPAVVRIPNVKDGTIDLTDQKRVVDPTARLEGLMLEPGDLLVVRTNGSRSLIGRTAVVPDGIDAAFASYLIRYVFDTAQVRPDWVQLMLERPAARHVLERLAASSAGQYNLGLKKLDGVAVPVPPRDEQERRMSEFNADAERGSRLRRSARAARQRASALRRALLAAAFSGRLTGRASDLDVAEELASA